MKLTHTLALLLAGSSGLMAQTAPSAGASPGNPSSTVVYTQPSAAATFLSANPGASLNQATANGLTFRMPNGSYRFASARGLTYQRNGQWVPTQVQVAALADGSGWVFGGVGYTARLVQGEGGDKELSISSGSTSISIHAPGLVYNNDDTFTFHEGASDWVMRITGYGITMRANVPKRSGLQQHTFAFESAGAAQMLNTAYGDLALDDAIHLTRAVLVGADKKTYAACTPWTISGSTLSFTCDDTKLPDAAIPYTIDPVLSTGPNWTDGTSVTLSQQYANPWGAYYMMDYGEWDAAFNISSIPSSTTVSSVSVNDSGMWAQLVNAGGSGTACMGGTPGSWSLPSGGQNLSQIPGQSTLDYSFGLQMGWYENGSSYFCTWSITGIGSLSLTVNYTVAQPLSITTSSLPSGVVGVPYSTALAAIGGSGAYTWSIYSGSLPAGLALSSGGVISGTPASPGTSSVTLQVADTSAHTATASFTLTISGATTITAYNNSSGTAWAGIAIWLDGYPNGGSACTTPCTLADGLAHSIQMPSPGTFPQGGAGSEAVFNSWSDGGANPHTIQAGASVTAGFTVYYQFTGNASPSNGGSVVLGTPNSQGVVVPSGFSANGWYPAGTSFWVTAQANSGFGFITLSNGYRQQAVAMNSAVTATANFSNNIFTVATSPQPKMAQGQGVTAHYEGSSTSTIGTTWESTLGSFSCYSVTEQISAAIANAFAGGGNLSFDAEFLSGASAAPGQYDITCSCAYFECFVDLGPATVTPAPTTISQNGTTIASSAGSYNCYSCQVVVGQQITLDGSPSGGTWSLGDGSTYSNFISNGSPQGPVAVNNSSNPVSFFWVPDGNNGSSNSYTVSYTVGGTMASATFTVAAPTVTLPPVFGFTPPLINRNNNLVAGNSTTVTVTPPPSFSGTVVWGQLFNTASYSQYGGGIPTNTCTPPGPFPGIDTQFPYGAGVAGAVVASGNSRR